LTGKRRFLLIAWVFVVVVVVVVVVVGNIYTGRQDAFWQHLN